MKLFPATAATQAVSRPVFPIRHVNVNAKFETLMSGGYIREVITEDLTYDSLEASEVNLWSLLFMTGYLTQVKDAGIEELPQETPSGKYRIQEKVAVLRIPNEEIKAICKTAIIDWFKWGCADRR